MDIETIALAKKLLEKLDNEDNDLWQMINHRVVLSRGINLDRIGFGSEGVDDYYFDSLLKSIEARRFILSSGCTFLSDVEKFKKMEIVYESVLVSVSKILFSNECRGGFSKIIEDFIKNNG